MRRSSFRSSPKILTAMFARVPGQHVIDSVGDGLPDRDVRARQQRQAIPNLLQHDTTGTIAFPQLDVDLRRLDALHVLVALGAAGAPCGAHDLRHLEQEPLQRRAEAIGGLQAGPGQGHGADDQRALVELREKRPPHSRHTQTRGHEQHAGDDEHRGRVIEDAREHPPVSRLHPPDQPGLAPFTHRPQLWQQIRRQDRRDRQRDNERGKQRDQIGESKGL